VPVGTGDEVERLIREARPEADFAVVSNPEFLREGAIADFKRPGRIVIGTQDERAAQVMRELTRPLYLNHSPILQTSRRTAELTKYAANAFLATKITFINEIADLCEQVGADVQQVARGIGLDNRIGGKFLHAGPGYGGSCIPKDTPRSDQDGAGSRRALRLVETTAAGRSA
jgi:UDPglucose 6-dehydrogenase